MTTELKYTLLRLAKVFRGGPEVYINKIDEDLADEIEKMLKVSTPKYDPCRLFKAGDIVEPCSVNGRWCSHGWEDRSGIHYEVVKDEDPLTGYIEVKGPESPHSFLGHAAFFKLFTPVEELERYVILHNDCAKNYEVCWKDADEPDGQTGRTRCRAKYYYHQPPQTYSQEEAKAAAEAEYKRLNAEHRKELKND